MSKLNPDEWSSSWKNPEMVTTFGGMFEANYDYEILDFWKKHLTSIDAEHVVDLACGNGALVWIANEILNNSGNKTKITGIDIADIDPFKILKKKKKNFPKVEFVGNSSIEKLPFDDASLDIIISQYGLEYSNLDLSVPEIARVIRPGGLIGFIMHNKNSVVVKPAKSLAELCDLIVCEGGLNSHYLALDDLFNRGVTDPAEVNKIVANINQSSYLVKSTLRSIKGGCPSVDNYFNDIGKVFPTYTPVKSKGRTKLLQGLSDALIRYIGRMNDLDSAGLTDQEFENFIGLLIDNGFELKEQGRLVYRNIPNFGSYVAAVKHK